MRKTHPLDEMTDQERMEMAVYMDTEEAREAAFKDAGRWYFVESRVKEITLDRGLWTCTFIPEGLLEHSASGPTLREALLDAMMICEIVELNPTWSAEEINKALEVKINAGGVPVNDSDPARGPMPGDDLAALKPAPNPKPGGFVLAGATSPRDVQSAIGPPGAGLCDPHIST